MILKRGKRGQVTIFIIIAIIVVAAIGAFFFFRDSLTVSSIPANLEPAYTSFLTCLEEDTLVGIDLLETQGGYIELPEFEPGSRYMPFSSQLDFLGNPIPYWYYVSGNNIEKEQVPSKNFMQNELGSFMESRISECDFSSYYGQGFEIGFESTSEPETRVVIRDNEVEVDLNFGITISKGDETVLVKDHHIVVNSNLGKLYDNAREVYDYEQQTLFLESYGVDTLRNYAPVDWVEITCSPQVWNADEVFDELQEGIELNTLSIKSNTNDFYLNNNENRYFVKDLPVDNGVGVRFLNSRDWTSGFEVNPTQGPVMISEPVGNQQGLGILGFCYVPYHYVYNARYPILVQVYSDLTEEVFQFPVAIVIEGNQPREASDSEAVLEDTSQLCEFKNTLTEVRVYDTNLNEVSGVDVSYECFSESCEIGKTSESGILSENFPQCVNGFMITRAEGYERSKTLYSVTEPGFVEIILNPVYEVEVNLEVDGKEYGGNAIVSFRAEDNSQLGATTRASRTIAYPELNTVELSEGQYEIQVFINRNSSIRLQETSYEECIEIPQSGIGGLFGFNKKQCFDVEIPSTIISNALSGGGTQNYFVLESELEKGKIVINAPSLKTPATLEQLQDNYALFEENGLDIRFE